METAFHYDPTAYREQVAHIADQVVSNDDAIPTLAPRIEFEENSYHGRAIENLERDRLSKLYPRLYL